ncbi:MAG: SUMF1/EgtB/PvdO family nonheme iron enzyme [Candidatus Schekmanbacteria bacterium]|nr:SUMF1/EgtB/PvdO family nonheme iron enzyme [Candidatus Schekmanbacteria bacterium]
MRIMNLLKVALIGCIIGGFIPVSYALDKEVKQSVIPEDMVLVPAGEFIMGNNNDYMDNDGDEAPQHVVNLPAFYIDKYPVTNAQYKKFVDATKHELPLFWDKSGNFPPEKSDHPVIGVTYLDAKAYCSWVGKRLPTEEEWEKAARGTDGRRWPWGNIFENSKTNVNNRKGTTPVNKYPAGVSPYGCYDMAGNTFEMTDTWYALYPGSAENRAVAKLLGEKYKVVRGGAYSADDGSARCADRGVKEINVAGPSLGFRCAQDVPGYEHYRSALTAINETKNLKSVAEKYITPYEEHNQSRLLLKDAEGLINESSDKFKNENFSESEQLATQASEKIKQAQQMALDFTKNRHEEKIAAIKEALALLEEMLNKMPAQLSPHNSELKEKALDHYKQSKQLFEDGSLGYAQMHVYIGLSIAGQIPTDAAASK